jgi:TonB family protein
MEADPTNRIQFFRVLFAWIVLCGSSAAMAQTDANLIRRLINPIDHLYYVWIPPGEFLMGCSDGDTECKDDERPPHRERIANGFWFAQTEVTKTAYQAVMGKNSSLSRGMGAPLPVDGVTWEESMKYCAAVGGRLPTEAEWEYAARGGTSGARYADLEEIAWHRANSRGWQIVVVGAKRSNVFGLRDMLGNVQEWVADAPAGSSLRILKGGSALLDARYARASSREWATADEALPGAGFRCAAGREALDDPAAATSVTAKTVTPQSRADGNQGTIPVKLLRQTDPEYTAAAASAGLQGVVTLAIVVNERGEVGDANVVQGLRLGLNEQAIAAVKKWKFRPAFKDGKPVPAAITVELTFRLQK